MTSSIILLCSCLFTLLVMPARTRAQAKVVTLRYRVLHHEEPIGNLTVTRTCDADSCTYRMTTRVRTRLVFTFTTASDEESTLINGSIVRSSFTRNINGRKTVKSLYGSHDQYWMRVNGEWRDMGRLPSCPSSLSLYHEEPRNRDQVWSDNYMERLPVSPAGNGIWKVEYPDGGNGFYKYEQGVASRIEMHTRLFDYAMVLEKKY